jgi:hypothetical protein
MANPGILPNLNVANVYTTLANTTVYTDKLRISTGNTAVTYNVYAIGLTQSLANGAVTTSTPVGNIYSANVQIPANTTRDVYSGAQNKVTVTGANWTATELGTASSAASGTVGQGS